MRHVLKVAPKSWQDHSSDFTVSLGPLPSLPYPAARPLRKPQLSHYGDPSAAWRQDGPFCQLTGAGTSQKQQCRPFPQGLIHAHKDPPRDLPSSARQSHYSSARGSGAGANAVPPLCVCLCLCPHPQETLSVYGGLGAWLCFQKTVLCSFLSTQNLRFSVH